MCKVLNIFLISLAILRLGQVSGQTAPRSPNFDILFVNDFDDYIKSNPGMKLTALEYHPNERTFTLGKKWDNTLFDLKYNMTNFQDRTFVYTNSYNYPKDVVIDIQYVELSYKNSYYDGLVFLKEGGIGQRYVSLVAKVGNTKDPILMCDVHVTGDIYDVID